MIWRGRVHDLVRLLGWKVWFYGLAIGPYGIGVIKRERARPHLGTNDEGRPSLDGRSLHAGDVA